MNRFVWSRSALAIAVSACAALLPGLAHAEESTPTEDSLSLKIANALRPDRFFVRAGVIGVKIKTKSSDTVDVTGPVMTKWEVGNAFVSGETLTNKDYTNINWKLNEADSDELQTSRLSGWQLVATGSVGAGAIADKIVGVGLGTPAGITGKAADSAGTAGISLGYFLDDEYKWAVEAYVLAAPLSSSVIASGSADYYSKVNGRIVSSRAPLSIDGTKIIKTKIVPPLVMFGRYWGDKDARVRPYTGAIAMYAIFTNSTVSDYMNTYVGGSNPGDTTVSMRNTFGMGPMVGVQVKGWGGWHANLNVGNVKLRTQVMLTTRNTMITEATPVVNELGKISYDIASGGRIVVNTVNGDPATYGDLNAIIAQNGGVTGMISKGVAADRAAGRTESGVATGDGQTLGTYTRKADAALNNTMFMLSVGRSF
jgi:outer membrane protein